MAVIDIFPQQEIAITLQDVDNQVYGWSSYPAAFALTVGETYHVVWHGTEYSCVAFSGGENFAGAVFIGNIKFVDGTDDTGEPFAFNYASFEDNGETVTINACITDDTAETTHTVYIYQETEGEDTGDDSTEEETPEGIVLKDRNGNDVAYYGIETVTFDTTTEGKQQTYSKGIVAESQKIPVTFAEGDMPIKASEGYLLKEFVLQKPDTLIPENIREGVTVAAVTGTFIGDTEETSVTLDLSAGDQVVSPSADVKVLSQVTIQKPETLVPENIAEGVEIAGVTGTLVAGGISVDSVLDGSLMHLESDIESATDYAGYYWKTIETASLPNVKTAGNVVFGSSSALKSVSLPQLETVGDSFLSYCTALEEACFPKLTSIGTGFCRNCVSLKKIDLPCLTKLTGYTFNYCSALTAVIFRANVMVTMTSADEWVTNSGNPFNTSAGATNAYIYVPSALLSTYKSATIWSKIKNKIRAIEDYPDICG